MRQTKVEILEEISDAMKLPSDILAGAPILYMVGQHLLFIENYKGIIEYTNQKIRLQTKIGKISIAGEHLLIEYYTVDDMKIKGYIDTIQFCE
ncbi:MAG: hypothetical protein PWP24_904 [Clostridiales bacterium]|nr:hypothetical protein [Clostridiales bacterium]